MAASKAPGDELTPETVEGLQKVYETLDDGTPVLSGGGKFGIPAMQDVPTEYTQHNGFGSFTATAEDGRSIDWDGGGAMRRDGNLSWTSVRGETKLLEEWLDYDREQVKRRVEQYLVGAEEGV